MTEPTDEPYTYDPTKPYCLKHGLGHWTKDCSEYKASDPTLLDSEIDRLQAKLNNTPRTDVKDMVCLERADLKALIATIGNEVIDTDIELDDEFTDSISDNLIPTDTVKVVKVVRRNQRTKLQELINGR